MICPKSIMPKPGIFAAGGIKVFSTNSSSYNDWIAGTFGGAYNNTSIDRVVMGTANGKATIAGHNGGLTAWADLIISPEAGSNVGIGTNSFTSNRLQVAGMVGASAFNTTSDRAAKEDFTAVDTQTVLAKLVALPITQWRFKDFPGVIHLGPTAQDFQAAFGLGVDDKSIATVDADGVALAAIQGLNQKLEETRAELRLRDAESVELKRRLQQLEQLVDTTSNGKK